MDRKTIFAHNSSLRTLSRSLMLLVMIKRLGTASSGKEIRFTCYILVLFLKKLNQNGISFAKLEWNFIIHMRLPWKRQIIFAKSGLQAIRLGYNLQYTKASPKTMKMTFRSLQVPIPTLTPTLRRNRKSKKGQVLLF